MPIAALCPEHRQEWKNLFHQLKFQPKVNSIRNSREFLEKNLIKISSFRKSYKVPSYSLADQLKLLYRAMTEGFSLDNWWWRWHCDLDWLAPWRNFVAPSSGWAQGMVPERGYLLHSLLKWRISSEEALWVSLMRGNPETMRGNCRNVEESGGFVRKIWRMWKEKWKSV